MAEFDSDCQQPRVDGEGKGTGKDDQDVGEKKKKKVRPKRPLHRRSFSDGILGLRGIREEMRRAT